MKITRTTFEPGDDLIDYVDAEGKLLASVKFRDWLSPEKPKRQRKPGGKATVFQQHFTPEELAREWRVSGDTIRTLFRNEPGVLKIDRPETLKKRGYESMRIPLDVAQRVHRRLTTRPR